MAVGLVADVALTALAACMAGLAPPCSAGPNLKTATTCATPDACSRLATLISPMMVVTRWMELTTWVQTRVDQLLDLFGRLGRAAGE